MNLFSWWRRAMADDGRLRLRDAARVQGVALGEPVSAVELREVALATRRCVFCAEQARCDAAIAAGDLRSLRERCPNTEFLDHLRRG